MIVYSCAHDWEAMLTCIYVAWAGKQGFQNIRLELEPVEEYSFFDEYTHVEPDAEKAASVTKAIYSKISPYVYHELAYCAMAYEKDVLDNIYHVLLLGFHHGPAVLEMVQYRDVMRNREIRKRLGNEVCRFKEFTRFHDVGGRYVAHIEPKSKLVESLGPIFQDRMPSEDWMIVDDVHREAVIHPKNSDYYLKTLSTQEFERVLKTEEENDSYTDLWQIFFDTIAIKERINPKCQMNHFPVWTRKHVVEFQS